MEVESFFSVDTLRSVQPGPGVTRRAALAGEAMMTFFTFTPGSTVPTHTHPHDQLSVVVKGRAEFTVDGVTRTLGPGDGAAMPGGTPHSVLILDEATEIWDAWAPPREEYR